MYFTLRLQVLANTEPLIGDWVEIVPPGFGGEILVICFLLESFVVILGHTLVDVVVLKVGLWKLQIFADIWRSCFTSIHLLQSWIHVNPSCDLLTLSGAGRGNLNFESMKSKSLAAAHLTNWVPPSEPRSLRADLPLAPKKTWTGCDRPFCSNAQRRW